MQGFVGSGGISGTFAEAVIVHFDPEVISLKVLIEIHLNTHQSTSNHRMRGKYRSAVYSYDKSQFVNAQEILGQLKSSFDKPIITRVMPFEHFQISPEKFRNYYFKNPEKPFCKKYIDPKLKMLLMQFSSEMK